jgi:predicted GIY-YIG superfamily endonuclease
LSKVKAEKQYVYIAQSLKEKNVCKIGITDNYERRLKEYNRTTGKSKGNETEYLFVCEVKDMVKVENTIKKAFPANREENKREIYFYNTPLFNMYVDFIKRNILFVKEVIIKPEDKKQITKIVKRTKPSLEERGLTWDNIMKKARKVDNDEFYTRYEDIEKEIQMYPETIWNDKTVFCNCDDAVDNNEKNTSNFSLYFLKNFKRLKLKKLICTHYVPGTVNKQYDLFNQGKKGYIFTKTGFKEIQDYNKLKEYPENYNGSFDHPISLDLLKDEADIVCTNPPFSRMKDYWKFIIESKKKFLIISNIANVLGPSYIPYLMKKQVWAGYTEVHWFYSPKKELTRAGGCWFTNFKITNRKKYKNLKIIPLKNIPEKSKRYDDDNILMVNHCYIPSDYEKPFAVSATPILNGLLENGYRYVNDKQYHGYVNGKVTFTRVLIQKIKDKK